VYEALRRDIMAVVLSPGAKLDEAELCRKYRVSRTPVREALIRLASEGLAEIEPNRGGRVASLQFTDVCDHYEAMELFLPVVCHLAALRHSREDIATIRAEMDAFAAGVGARDQAAMVRHNYNLHVAIAAAAHNRCVARGYEQMLADKLRLAQHGLAGNAHEKGRALADRFRNTAAISARLVKAIEAGRADDAAKIARDLNAWVRSQVAEALVPAAMPNLRIPGWIADRSGEGPHGNQAARPIAEVRA
jgi:DNA-binding GntR family transcriptional regulator